jgi:hypothetical protein
MRRDVSIVPGDLSNLTQSFPTLQYFLNRQPDTLLRTIYSKIGEKWYDFPEV